jgi:hypothetical protein
MQRTVKQRRFACCRSVADGRLTEFRCDQFCSTVRKFVRAIYLTRSDALISRRFSGKRGTCVKAAFVLYLSYTGQNAMNAP